MSPARSSGGPGRPGRRADVDVVVAGAGPAGALTAAACARRGLRTLVVDPAPHDDWSSTYATWVDDLAEPGTDGAGLDPGPFLRNRSAEVVVRGRADRRVGREYGVVDGAAVREQSWTDLRAGAGEIRRGEVSSVSISCGGATAAPRPAVEVGITSVDGVDELTAAVVLDATGWTARIARGRRGPPPPVTAWQTAYGVFVDEVPDGADVVTDVPTLMDWRRVRGRTDDGDEIGVPTFLYAVPVGSRWLLEETVLASTQPVEPERLRSRLVARLGATGEEVVRAAEADGRVERVVIPMGVPRPSPPAGVVPIGAAAGLVHPATGYSFATSWRLADEVATAIAEGRDPWERIWPRRRRRVRAIHEFGLDVLLGLDDAGTAGFFDAFFALPVRRWRPYLRVDATPREVTSTMWELFRSAPWSLRRRLVRGDPRRLRTGH